MRVLGQLGPGFFLYFRTKKRREAHNGVGPDLALEAAGKLRLNNDVMAIILAIEDSNS